jgi:hypothetical protein
MHQKKIEVKFFYADRDVLSHAKIMQNQRINLLP